MIHLSIHIHLLIPINFRDQVLLTNFFFQKEICIELKGHSSLQKGGCLETHDIEDVVKVAEVVKGRYFSHSFL